MMAMRRKSVLISMQKVQVTRRTTTQSHVPKSQTKLLTELVGMCTKDQAIDNDLWDCGQLRAVEGVLNTVDLLIKIVPEIGTKVFSH